MTRSGAENRILPLTSAWKEAVRKVRRTAPVVHCITNYVTSGICADILLAAGASPIMADELLEVREIVSIADALVLNLGTLNSRIIESVYAAGKAAAERKIPILLDPAGAGASRLRTETGLSIIEEIHPQIVRGNLTEISALAGKTIEKPRGVDAVPAGCSPNQLAERSRFIAELARKWKTTVGVSGQIDIISDGHRTCMIGGGDPMMTKASGCGCMLSAVTGGFLAAEPDPWIASSAAFALMSLCGKEGADSVSAQGGGPSQFRRKLNDLVYHFTPDLMLNADLRCYEDDEHQTAE